MSNMIGSTSGSYLVALCVGLAFAAPAAPRSSPPFAIRRVGGEKPLQLSSYRGRPVVLVFISTTCPHCQELTRKLVPMAKEVGSRAQFLECAVNESAEADLPGFIRELRPSFPVGFSSQVAVNKFLHWSSARVFFLPHIVLLDAKGVIRGDYAAETAFFSNAAANIRAELNKLLREQVPAGETATTKN